MSPEFSSHSPSPGPDPAPSPPPFGLHQCLILSSEPRSGSTWVAELLTQAVPLSILFESLHPAKGLLPAALRPARRLHFDDADATHAPWFAQLLTGCHTNHWNSPSPTVFPRPGSHFLFHKLVRATLLLPWFTRQFPQLPPPVLLLRHPVATTLSQIKNFGPKLLPEPGPAAYHSPLLAPHADFLAQLETELERQLALWFIHTLPTLCHPRHNHSWHTVYYEAFLLRPLPTLRKLLQLWNLPIKEARLTQIDSTRRSNTDFSNQPAAAPPREQLSRWRCNLDPALLARLQTIFDHFEFTLYSVDSDLPFDQPD